MSKRKFEVENDLKKNPNDARYAFIEIRNRKSSVWERFTRVQFEDQFEDLARCETCKELLMYSTKTGTGSLLRHKCPPNRSTSVLKQPPKNHSTEPKISSNSSKGDHHEFYNKFSFLISSDLSPFSALEGDEWQESASGSNTVPLTETAKNPSTQPKITSYLDKNVPLQAQEEINKELLFFIAKDLMSFSVVEGEGFGSFAQELINFGAQFGSQDINNVLVTSRKLIQTVIPQEYNSVKSTLEPILKEEALSFTTDMWIDENTQTNYISLTAYFINDDFQFKNKLLGVKELRVYKKTAEHILASILDILRQFNIEEQLKTAVIVTGNDTDIIGAFKGYKTLSCACRNLNLAIEDVFEKEIGKHRTEDDVDFEFMEIRNLIEASKKVIGHFKHSKLNKMQNVNMRWNSTFWMLEFIFEKFDEIQQFLDQVNETDKIASIDYNLLQSLVSFLRVFKECSEQLSSEGQPTIHTYSLWFEHFKRHCWGSLWSRGPIEKLKKCIWTAIVIRMEPTLIHNAALFLNPQYKQLQCLSEQQRLLTKATVKSMLQNLQNDDTIADGDEFENLPNSTSNSAKRKSNFYQFRDKYPVGDDMKDCAETEIYYYLEMEIENVNEDDDEIDVLKYWSNVENLPLLKRLAKKILSVPASSSISERLFSKSDRILVERRSRMNTENLDQMLFLHKNL